MYITTIYCGCQNLVFAFSVHLLTYFHSHWFVKRVNTNQEYMVPGCNLPSALNGPQEFPGIQKSNLLLEKRAKTFFLKLTCFQTKVRAKICYKAHPALINILTSWHCFIVLFFFCLNKIACIMLWNEASTIEFTVNFIVWMDAETTIIERN